MAAETPTPTHREHGNAYNIFVLVLTLFSLLIMVLQLLPLDASTLNLLRIYDNAICVIFLGDFLYNLTGSRPKREYFIYQRGWLDLLGSLPTLGIFQLTALFRLARLSRLARIARMLGGKNRNELIRDVVQNRGQYALFITLLSAGIVLVVASLIVLEAEAQSPDANIKNGGDALWWALVTITTVGYGDRFPVTPIGRSTAVFVMLAGVGIIGALASILASLLVPSAEEMAAADDDEGGERIGGGGGSSADVARELALLRAEVAELRAAITERTGASG
jgi:voltage-gated potassium channel